MSLHSVTDAEPKPAVLDGLAHWHLVDAPSRHRHGTDDNTIMSTG